MMEQNKATNLGRYGNVLENFEPAPISDNSQVVLNKRYLLKDENDNVVENPNEMFIRVAKALAKIEKTYGSKDEEKRSRTTKKTPASQRRARRSGASSRQMGSRTSKRQPPLRGTLPQKTADRTGGLHRRHRRGQRRINPGTGRPQHRATATRHKPPSTMVI